MNPLPRSSQISLLTEAARGVRVPGNAFSLLLGILLTLLLAGPILLGIAGEAGGF